ncbi:MAG: HNH endonuclease [Gaiellales bacterium]|nr:HNH endonuclease [Gaiellales bacterium]
MPRHVLVLNTTYEPINVCSLKRALILVLKDRAEVLESTSHRVRSEKLSLARPTVVRLRTYVKIPPGERRRISRRAVMARDGFRCQYCGSTRQLTLDHIVPTSRGGRTTWENLVTSCAPCNVRKGARLLGEIGMALHTRPRPPSLSELLMPGTGELPDDWITYLAPATT